ncbi:hypothetical protein H2248_002582 [Termitomyces sp. 'cryptogamus']|nr:hypothetical protein H2248_002582 [Termitomyces sp. 'cryptogamus']
MSNLISAGTSEETPLLPSPARGHKQDRTPLPWRQFSIVMLLQVSEPLKIQVISPFVPQVAHKRYYDNENQVGYYVGLLHSLFFIAQVSIVLHWSRISDNIGRKPVVLIGLLELTPSMVSFGLSKTFWTLVLKLVGASVTYQDLSWLTNSERGSRCICGALDGNVGIIKSIMAELTDSTNIAQTYAYLPIAWSAGGSVGPIIGGILFNPTAGFPCLFAKTKVLKEYPYFLPCAIKAAYSTFIWVISLLFLEDAHKSPMPISRLFRLQSHDGDKRYVLRSDVIVQYHIPSSEDNPLPLHSLLAQCVLISAGNCAFFAMLKMTFRTIQPLFLSTPIPLGGLGLPPSIIGQILSAYGILNGIFRMLFLQESMMSLRPR